MEAANKFIKERSLEVQTAEQQKQLEAQTTLKQNKNY